MGYFKDFSRRALRLGFALASTAAARPVVAQSGPAAALDQVVPGKFVRARLDAGRSVSGSYVPLGDGRLGIRSDQGATDTLRLGELRELSVRGRHTKTGAIIGGIAGVGFGIFVGVMTNGFCETDSCRGVRPYALAIPAFGGGGALLGAALGSAFPKWKKVFP